MKKTSFTITKIIGIGLSILIVIMILFTIYEHMNVLMFKTEMNGLIGHPLADVIDKEDYNTSIEILSDSNQLEMYRKHIYTKTKISAIGKVVIVKHTAINMYAALIFLDHQDRVYAVHIGGLNYNALAENR